MGVTVGLVDDAGPVALTNTDRTGRYTFNDVAPGGFRVQLADPCCGSASRQVTVVPGQVSKQDLQLERLTPTDLRIPHIVERDWSGFIACEVSVLSQGNEACGTGDTNRDDEHVFYVGPGLVEIVLAMDWDQVGTSLMPDLRLSVAHPGTPGNEYRTRATYGVYTGPPPIVETVRNEEGTNPSGRFDLIEDQLDIEYSVSSGNTNVVYQQPFTIRWAEAYFAPVPGDYSPLPDG